MRAEKNNKKKKFEESYIEVIDIYDDVILTSGPLKNGGISGDIDEDPDSESIDW